MKRYRKTYTKISMKNFSRTQTITKKNLEGVPSREPGVYRIKSSSDQILYIGKAKGGRLDDHIWEHRGRFQKGTRFQFKVTSDSKAAERLERKEIMKHVPPRNRRK